MIKTGITTDEKFREAVNANGANVKSSSVPKTLKDALSTFGKEVSYNITNENVLRRVGILRIIECKQIFEKRKYNV